MTLSGRYFILLLISGFFYSCDNPHHTQSDSDGLVLEKTSDTPPMNVIFILSDDHRYDFMGFTGKVPFLQTPNMDKMAKEGTHIHNAFVTTSLCSPSRASILTGQFSHRHQVVDNQSPVPDRAIFFPQYLQKYGYETSFFGKWHMGEHHANPRKGFDYWVSFKGQGVYYNPTLNIDGEEVEYTDSTYITDLLTEKAIEWLGKRKKDKPFFMYLSHKGVHSEFSPAKRHQDVYEGTKPQYPPTMFPASADTTKYNYKDVPDWVKKQRHSWHGVDYMYHGQINFDEFYENYNETLLSIDESIGDVLSYLEENDLLESTLVFYMGDNGFSFGEHGLIDKRHAYEESIRVPLLAYGGGQLLQKDSVGQLIQNIDIAPTILALAGLEKPANMDGQSFVPLLKGETPEWRDRIYYEYFWERPFPQTPTVHAVRTDKYKYIRYYGIWDINELYDIENDPMEMNNLIRSEEHQPIAKELRADLFNWLERTGGMQIPLKEDRGARFDHGYKNTY
ncbi:Choline-sulfatase [Fulvivirga imtechensis AK7]|uniref:Choline-sulfatase n=1 Tax=Fulvivirga imtechensis AK7 TaxID=1237149 RepID=L8JQ91_9BACT|nr:sulfatase [Fulvivirga imtechensis]ELR69547.1 Choline-sulfatase [Fulvivirga imtechensis AK7]